MLLVTSKQSSRSIVMTAMVREHYLYSFHMQECKTWWLVVFLPSPLAGEGPGVRRMQRLDIVLDDIPALTYRLAMLPSDCSPLTRQGEGNQTAQEN